MIPSLLGNGGRGRGERIALLFLALVALLFFRDVLFGPNALVTSNMSRWLPWRATATLERQARPSFRDDAAETYYPRRHLSAEELEAGRVPLWNRYILCGTPHLADFQSCVFHPLNLLLYRIDHRWAMGAFVVFHLLLGAFFLFLLSRRLGVGNAGATVGGLSFLFNAYFATYLGHPPHISTGCWLPALLLLARRQVRRGWTPLLPLAAALTILGGFPQTILYVFTISSAFALVEWGGLPRPERRRGAFRIAALGLLIAVGAGITLFQILPTAELGGLSERRNIPVEEILRDHQPRPWSMIRAVLPDFFGNPVDENYWIVPYQGALPHPSDVGWIGYGGVLPLLLAGAALLFRRRRETIFFGAVAAFSLALAFSPHLFRLFHRLVPFARFSAELHRLQFPFLFSVAVLAGFGFDAIAERLAGANRRRVIAYIAAWMLAAPLLAAATGIWGGAMRRDARERMFRVELSSIRPAVVPPHARIWLEGRSEEEWAAHQWKVAFRFGAIVLAGGAALLLIGKRGRAGRAAAAAAILIVLADGWTFARVYYTPQPRDEIFADHPSLQTLRAEEEEPFRVSRFTREYMLPSNTGLPYGIEDLGGVNALLPAHYARVFEAIDPNLFPDGRRITAFHHPSDLFLPLWDLLNLKYILVPDRYEPANGPARNWEEALEGSDRFRVLRRPPLTLLENTRVLPRAFLRHDWVVEKNRGEILRRITVPGFDPRGPLFIEEDPAIPRGTAPELPEDLCEVIRREGPDVTLRARSGEAGLLFLSETDFPGWEAAVDGVPAPILRADYAFRAVAIPAGEHEVSFRYRPRSFRRGVIGSALFAALYLVLVAVAARRRLPARRDALPR
ncbi:MAG: YfhO family protein [Candidatus Eisenbacteria bacterium]|nr:YfhO family protein [Candidatus Eisenbacteria bacterium]